MAQGSGVLARRTEEECRPLLLSMFRVLKELLHYCEEHSRSDLAEEVAEALSMCQADFTKLKERLNAGTVERAGVDGQAPELSALQLSPLASHTAGPADDAAAAPSSPLQDPLADSPNSNSHMLSQLETLDIEQLQEAARYFSCSGEAPLMPRRVHDALYLQEAGCEGRGEAARRFLDKLHGMMLLASKQAQGNPIHGADGLRL
eukprot:CAMPEP_0118821180 /NCGR_PEP_ID=MMETSP1162-20130426/8263_1 /TAXON_ID=33656 /ORGANISM="Phaeocystis Sp, Strain CCMP2710" /LENGTH=203 /DNA_ID=CAMNT_0006751623 /DNA_START=40 /DNA_END=647 /DNA_ORIENTATION=-